MKNGFGKNLISTSLVEVIGILVLVSKHGDNKKTSHPHKMIGGSRWLSEFVIGIWWFNIYLSYTFLLIGTKKAFPMLRKG